MYICVYIYIYLFIYLFQADDPFYYPENWFLDVFRFYKKRRLA